MSPWKWIFLIPEHNIKTTAIPLDWPINLMNKTYIVIKYSIDISLILVTSLLWGDLKWSLLTPAKSNITPSQWQVCFGCRCCITFSVPCNLRQLSYFDHIKFQYCEPQLLCSSKKPMHIHTNLWFPIYPSSTITVLHFTVWDIMIHNVPMTCIQS